jgi:hypothetical protein
MVRPVWRSVPYHARPRRAALYASYGLLVGFHTLAFWKTMRRLGTVPEAVSKGTQQACPFLLSHILFCHSARDDAHLFRGDPNLCMTGVSVSKHGLRRARRAVVALAEAALVLHLHDGRCALCAAQAGAGSRAKSELQHERHRDGALGRHRACRIRVNTRWSKGTPLELTHIVPPCDATL